MPGNGQQCESKIFTTWPLIIVGIIAITCKEANLFMSPMSLTDALYGNLVQNVHETSMRMTR